MHILVTGASSGIGRALAQAFARDGARLSLVARRRALLEELAGELPVPAAVIPADLADSSAVPAWLAAAEEAHGPIDVLVNNAGTSYIEPVQGIDAARSRKLFEVNVHTPLEAIHRVLPAMLERRAGTIINVASNAAFNPAPYLCHYTATKGAIGNFTESLRMELRGTGVHVVAVYPGPIHTPMADRNWQQLEETTMSRLAPVGRPEDLARLVVRAADRKRARVIFPRFYALAWWLPGVGRLVSQWAVPPAKGHTTPPLPGDEAAS